MEERQFKGVWIPREIWLSEDLTIQEKVILVEIDSLETEDRGCYASNKYFSDFFKLTSQRVSQIIKNLESKNYLKIDYITKDKQIIERQIRIQKPPYPEVSNIFDRGIKFLKGGYQENFKENNTYTNNTNNNKYIVEIIDYLNEKTNSNYKTTTKATEQKINARLREGFTLEDFKKVIDKKTDEWMGTQLEQYLRPDTLFGTKFESYLNQNIIKQEHKETRYEREQRIMKEWLEKNEED